MNSAGWEHDPMAEGQSGLRGAKLQLALLGGFAARDGAGREIAIASRKAQALLAFLAVSAGKPQPREKLTALLWSDRGEAQARSSLRQALSELRKALPESDPPLLMTQRDSVWLDPGAVQVDAVVLERLIDGQDSESVAKAVELFRGDFLDGLDVRDPAFEEWRCGERERLREQSGQALIRLLDLQTGKEAIATARRLLALDPLNEATHRTLMRLYAEAGDRTMALRQYEACREVLRTDLGLEPDGTTRKLAEEIAQDDLRGEGDRAALQSAESKGADGELPLLPHKPAVVVLPFVNMSGDPEQEYFSDGITEDIITGLTYFRDISVIARNSSFAFKGQPTDVAEVGRKLGADFVVEGSVRKAGGKVRITAQLIDASTGAHLWAHRYDRDLEDIFAVQDDVTQTVVGTLAGRLETVGVERARKKPTLSRTAFDYLLQGRDLLYRYNREDNAKARELLQKAIALDPKYAEAHAWLSETYMTDWDGGWAGDLDACLERGREIAERAVALDDSDSRAQAQMGWVLNYLRQYGQARHHINRALALNPHHPDMAMVLGFCEIWHGDAKTGLEKVKEAMRLDPFGHYGIPLGIAHYSLREYEDAVVAFNSVRAKLPMVIAWRAASCAKLGRQDQARSAAKVFLEVARLGMTACGAPLPENWLDFLAQRAPFEHQENLNQYLDGLREAGLPE